MKKLLKKIKIWLIHKLGGTYQPDEKIIKHIIARPIRLSSQIELDFGDYQRMGDTFIKKEFASNLANEIMKNENLYKVRIKQNEDRLTITLRAEILVYEREACEE